MRQASARSGAVACAAALLVMVSRVHAAGCPPQPRPLCRTGQWRLRLDHAIDDRKDRVSWALKRAAATTQGELGSPTANTAWSFCLWDGSGLRVGIDLPAAGVCAGRPCWKAVGTRGYRYRNPASATSGVERITLIGGAGNKTRIVVAGRGGGLLLPTLPLAAPVTVQLLRDDAPICFESVAPPATFTANSPDRVLASGDGSTAVPALPSAGCGQPLVPWTAGVSTTDTLVHDGLARSFRVFVPAPYDPTIALPVVVLLHGGFGSGAQIEASSRLLDVAAAEGFIVVSPDGVASAAGVRTWNGGGCCGYAMSAAVDDVGFVRAIVDRLEDGACIDRRRVYVTGMSNGAILSHRLGCDLADRIRAIAPVAGTDMTQSCVPVRPVPVLEIHGTDDSNVPFAGGPGCGLAGVSFTSVPDTIARWSRRAACRGASFISLRQGDGTCTRQGVCGAGTDVDLCVIAGGGHQWPGGLPPVVPGIGSCLFGDQSQTFSASSVAWAFFAQHPPR